MSDRSHSVSLDRRTFLKVGVLGGGGLVINLALPLALRPALAQPTTSTGRQRSDAIARTTASCWKSLRPK